MGICFCCLSEADKVGRVLARFAPAPVSAAKDGMLQKLVGRVVLAGTRPFYAPGSGMPCVWYRVAVFEERIRVREQTDANGDVQIVREEYWQEIVKDERFMDFWLQDGTHKLFVNASRAGLCRIQGTRDAGRSSIFNAPPPGIQMLVAQRLASWRGWTLMEGATGRFRYVEESFNVNELLACLGVVSPGMDPYTRAPCKILQPFTSTSVTPEFMEANQWSDFDKRSWQDLLKSPAVLISDHAEFTGTVVVQPAMNLPPWMVQAAAPGAYTAAMFAPGYGAPAGGAGMGAGAGAGVPMGAANARTPLVGAAGGYPPSYA